MTQFPKQYGAKFPKMQMQMQQRSTLSLICKLRGRGKKKSPSPLIEPPTNSFIHIGDMK